MWELAYKQIRANKRSTLWLLTELFVVSILLWYCVDFLYVIGAKRMEPQGVNTEHVYKVTMRFMPKRTLDSYSDEEREQLIMAPREQIFRMLQEHPSVESATYFLGTELYATDPMFQAYRREGQEQEEDRYYNGMVRYVEEHFFEVFRIAMVQGQIGDWQNSTFPQSAVVTEVFTDSVFGEKDVIGKRFYDVSLMEGKDDYYTVTAIAQPTKFDIYSPYTSFVYLPIPKFAQYMGYPFIIRVKENVDSPRFAEDFFSEIKDKLQIGDYYPFKVESYGKIKSKFDLSLGIPLYISIAIGLVVFFLFIVFIGIIGSYWFMVQSRRGEVALRMVVGSSPSQVTTFLMRESTMVLLMAYIPALFSMVALAYFEITYTFQECMPYTWGRFWITQAITFVVLLVVVLLGVVIPARRASKLDPAVILNEE